MKMLHKSQSIWMAKWKKNYNDIDLPIAKETELGDLTRDSHSWSWAKKEQLKIKMNNEGNMQRGKSCWERNCQRQIAYFLKGTTEIV